MDCYERFIITVSQVDQVYTRLLDLRAAYLALGATDARHLATASKVAQIIDRFSVDLNRLARDTASFADREIIGMIRSRLVRPPTGQQPGLVDAIHSQAVNRRGQLGSGEVEIAQLPSLNRVPYWEAQEWGSSHNVGRVFFGLFQPSGTRPSQALFRQDPQLQIGPGGGRGEIRRPIPPKFFLRDGTDSAFALWDAQVRAASARAAGAINSL